MKERACMAVNALAVVNQIVQPRADGPLPPPSLANLPFGSTAAMLRRLLGDPRSRLERADLIVQEEAARRYAAVRPGTPERIIWGAWHELEVGRRLGPGCFRPPPRVGAAVLVARRRRPPLVPVGGHHRFTGLVEGPSAIPGCRCAGWTPGRATWTPPSGPAAYVPQQRGSPGKTGTEPVG
jgi:16S rRNA A1518/A1519 N6-dimethyltransferase RsmA/KsgA/DIM1 with predicted DNA glycosylase/AP lyase activity